MSHDAAEAESLLCFIVVDGVVVAVVATAVAAAAVGLPFEQATDTSFNHLAENVCS